jgi:hypothetical protein
VRDLACTTKPRLAGLLQNEGRHDAESAFVEAWRLATTKRTREVSGFSRVARSISCEKDQEMRGRTLLSDTIEIHFSTIKQKTI